MKAVVLGVISDARTLSTLAAECEVEVALAGSSLGEVRSALTLHTPDVLLVGFNGDETAAADLELVSELSREFRIPTVVLARPSSGSFVSRTLAAGAVAYVVQGEPPETLCHAVSMAAAGDVWVSDAVRPALLREVAEHARRVWAEVDAQRSLPTGRSS